MTNSHLYPFSDDELDASGIPDPDDDGTSHPVTDEAWTWHERLAAEIPITFPPAAGFLAEQITESASAMQANDEPLRYEQGILPGTRKMQPVPKLCPAVCTGHTRGCVLHLDGPNGDEHTTDPHGNTLHTCLATGWGHHFIAGEALW